MTHDNVSEWLEMRIELWPHCPLNRHKKEISDQLSNPAILQGFMAILNGQTAGFLEASIHQNAHQQFGSAGYIEGWYVKPQYRKNGVGQRLVKAAEDWTFEKGLDQIASDTEDFNFGSISAHKKLGYIEKFQADGEVKFLKALQS